MAKALFICGTDHEAGSSVVSLGLYSVLRRVVPALGFYKPICSSVDDIDVAVIRNAFGLADTTKPCCSLDIDAARDLLARKRKDELLLRVEAGVPRDARQERADADRGHQPTACAQRVRHG
ncbi:MAG: AAA family ATPase, partial [Acidobacteria bacterium]|nr:AAA family ATPase [Acidobacteriota bacterium]